MREGKRERNGKYGAEREVGARQKVPGAQCHAGEVTVLPTSGMRLPSNQEVKRQNQGVIIRESPFPLGT